MFKIPPTEPLLKMLYKIFVNTSCDYIFGNMCSKHLILYKSLKTNLLTQLVSQIAEYFKCAQIVLDLFVVFTKN